MEHSKFLFTKRGSSEYNDGSKNNSWLHRTCKRWSNGPGNGTYGEEKATNGWIASDADNLQGDDVKQVSAHAVQEADERHVEGQPFKRRVEGDQEGRDGVSEEGDQMQVLTPIALQERLSQRTGDKFAEKVSRSVDDVQPFCLTHWHARILSTQCLKFQERRNVRMMFFL